VASVFVPKIAFFPEVSMGSFLSGRPPVPTAILEARGSRKVKGRAAAGEPRPPVKAPPCPRWLSKEAKGEWRRVAKVLVAMRVLTEGDRAVLAGYCQAWAEFRQADEMIQKTGLLIKDPEKGTLRRNPLLMVRSQAHDRMTKDAAQLGLTPAARTRVREIEEAKGGTNAKARFFGDN
jgi:P27 family predicted phage terminase small subunit